MSRDLKEVRGPVTSLATYGEGSSALENLLGEAGRQAAARPQRASQIMVKTWSFLHQDSEDTKAEAERLGGPCRWPGCSVRTKPLVGESSLKQKGLTAARTSHAGMGVEPKDT